MEEIFMFKLTCFAPIEPEQLGKALKGIHFNQVRNGFEWAIDGSTFRIEPFENQPRTSLKGYRITFNCDLSGGLYLFDLSLGCLGAYVTGIEFILEHPSMFHANWMKEMRKRPSFKMIDPRGLFFKNGINIVLVNDSVTIKMHSRKNKKLILADCIKQIDLIREELQPNDFNLFSFQREDIA